MGGAPVIEAVRPGVQLAPAAAASFRRLEARLGRPADVNRTYADYNTQMRMYLAWQAYVTGNGPHPGHSRALHPDQSMHCRGLAWDTDDWRTPGFITLAAEYGWIRTAASDPTEQHHFEYQSWRDQHRNDLAGGGAQPLNLSKPALPEEEDMPEIISSPIGQSLALGGLVVSFPSPADVQTALKAGYHVFETTSAMHRAILAAAAPDEDLRSFIIVTGDPSGTVYTFDGDSLDPIYDPSTVESLKGLSGVDVVQWSPEEIRLRRAAQGA